MQDSQCDIIIPAYNRLELFRDCLQSIYERTHISFRLIIIDNGSSRDTKDFISGFRVSHDNVSLIDNERNLGWVKAVNQGMKISSAPYVCIMNNDTVVRTDDWLSVLIATANADPRIGLVNPEFGIKKRNGPIGRDYTEVDFCRGYCILIKRAVIDKIGGLNEEYGLGYYDDDDYSMRAVLAGFRCVKSNRVFVEHVRDSTFKSVFREDERMALHEANKALFYAKWGRKLRLLFITKKFEDRHAFSDLLLDMARRQHRVYLWNMSGAFNIEHTNVAESVLPALIPDFVFSVLLYMNTRKNRAKRYDAIFTEDDNIFRSLSNKDYPVHKTGTGKDAGDVVGEVVAAVSRS